MNGMGFISEIGKVWLGLGEHERSRNRDEEELCF